MPKGRVLALACLLWGAPSARADVIYQYTGPGTTSAGPGTTSDFVSATFTLPTALGDNLSNFTVCNAQATPAINCTFPFRISDGVDTPLTNANSSLQFLDGISTNGDGIPTDWSFFVEATGAGLNVVSISSGSGLGVPGEGVPAGDGEDAVKTNNGNASVLYIPSSQYWSVVPVPEPSTLTLCAIGLSLLAAVNQRRKA